MTLQGYPNVFQVTVTAKAIHTDFHAIVFIVDVNALESGTLIIEYPDGSNQITVNGFLASPAVITQTPFKCPAGWKLKSSAGQINVAYVLTNDLRDMV